MPLRKIFNGNTVSCAVLLAVLPLFFLCYNTISASSREEALPSARVTPVVKAVREALPSVVNLSTEKVLDADASSGQTRSASENTNGNDKSLGSGSIIDASGLVVTNSHVVHSASIIWITLSDGQKYPAEEIANDELCDLALLRMLKAPKDLKLKSINTAEPGDLLLGETVIAVGNPYGLGSSISQGVLSAIDRKLAYNGKTVFSDIIQTDAAVYPGNSGGPLINLDGRMIGINTAIHKEARGIGFAIPLMRVENTLAKWLIPEVSNNAYLGIVPGCRRNKEGEFEIFIADVAKDSPAWEAGLRGGELIRKFDEEKVTDLLELSRKLWRLKNGDRVSITLDNNLKYDLKLEDVKLNEGKALARKRLGISVQELTPQLAKALGYPFDGGLIVSDISDGELEGIQRGDVISRLGDVSIHNAADISRALKKISSGGQLSGVLISVNEHDGKPGLQKKNVEFKVK